MRIEKPYTPPHGTSNRYKNYGCRCEPCSDAGSEWMREYYRRTEGLTKMVRTGEKMNLGSQGGAGARGPHKNTTRRMPRKTGTGRKKPVVVDFEPDSD